MGKGRESERGVWRACLSPFLRGRARRVKKALVILYKYPKTKEGGGIHRRRARQPRGEAFFDPLVPSVRVRPSSASSFQWTISAGYGDEVERGGGEGRRKTWKRLNGK